MLLLALLVRSTFGACRTDSPPVWPDALTIVQRRIPDPDSAVDVATAVTYYDYDQAHANLIVITPDANASAVLWDLELDTRQSYYFTPSVPECSAVKQPVGILRPDWLAGATYIGPTVVNGRACQAWTKADFIDYYADAASDTCEPVSWYFHGMKARFDTILWAPGLRAPNESYFEPPAYCNASSA